MSTGNQYTGNQYTGKPVKIIATIMDGMARIFMPNTGQNSLDDKKNSEAEKQMGIIG